MKTLFLAKVLIREIRCVCVCVCVCVCINQGFWGILEVNVPKGLGATSNQRMKFWSPKTKVLKAWKLDCIRMVVGAFGANFLWFFTPIWLKFNWIDLKEVNFVPYRLVRLEFTIPMPALVQKRSFFLLFQILGGRLVTLFVFFWNMCERKSMWKCV